MPVYQQIPQNWPPSYPQPQRPAAPQPVAVRPQPKPPATVRGAMPEEPRVSRLPTAMPSPEQLGIALPKPADWTDLRIRLDRLGANQFALSKQDDGWRFRCQLPDGRSLEGRGTTDADAVLNALAQVR